MTTNPTLRMRAATDPAFFALSCETAAEAVKFMDAWHDGWDSARKLNQALKELR